MVMLIIGLGGLRKTPNGQTAPYGMSSGVRLRKVTKGTKVKKKEERSEEGDF